MRIIFTFIILLNIAHAQTQKILGEAGYRFPQDTTAVNYSNALLRSRYVYDDLSNVYNTRGKFLNLYKTLLNGSNIPGQSVSRGDVHIRFGAFGDEMGNYLSIPIYQKMRAMFGNGGSILESVAPSGGGYVHTNVNETDYWFNGQWSGINGSGDLLYTLGGGRVNATVLKVYYIKEPGAGSFQVQSDSGAGYVDEGGVINANGATTEAGIVTIPKPLGNYSIKINQVSGNIRILFCAAINEAEGQDGVAIFRFYTNGLEWSKANETPKAITAPVFADLGLNLAMLQFKESSNAYTPLKEWFGAFRTASPTTDWSFNANMPQAAQDSLNKVNNAVLKQIAFEDSVFYFDGYNPLMGYSKVTNLGWQGNGSILHPSTGFYLASQLWRIIGIESILMLGQNLGTDKTGNPVIFENKRLKFYSSVAGLFGSMYGGPNGMKWQSYGRFELIDTVAGGRVLAFYNPQNGGFMINTDLDTRGYTWNITGSPGYYRKNDGVFAVFANRGTGVRGSLEALDLRTSSMAVSSNFSTAHASAAIEINSTTKGLLPSRMNETQKDAITSPATGLIIYQTNGTPGFYYYTGTRWVLLQQGARGTATLVNGTITVNSAAVATGSSIVVSHNTPSGTPGILSAPSASRIAGTSFVINSSSALDNSTVDWIISN